MVLQTLIKNDHETSKKNPHKMESKSFEVLNEETNKEIKLIKKLLTMQTLMPMPKSTLLTPISIDQCIVFTADSFSEKLRKRKLKLLLNIESGLPKILADLYFVRQILEEAFTNACKFNPDGEKINISVSAQSSFVNISISNYVSGLSSDSLSHLFYPFFRYSYEDPWKYGGLGIGLTLVKKLTESLGGSVQAAYANQIISLDIKLPIHQNSTQ